jgi:hypothetical protein
MLDLQMMLVVSCLPLCAAKAGCKPKFARALLYSLCLSVPFCYLIGIPS